MTPKERYQQRFERRTQTRKEKMPPQHPMNGAIEVPLIQPTRQIPVEIGLQEAPNAQPVHLVNQGPKGISVLIIGGLTKQQHLAAMLLAPLNAQAQVDGQDIAAAFEAANAILSFIPPTPPAAAAAGSPAPPAT